jgi:DNA-binding transcriptional ArsR family regulator
MRVLHHPRSSDMSLAGVLYALGDPLRLKIVARLAVAGEMNCAELECAIARSTMSHHFKILREAGIVRTRKEGTQHLNSLRREELEQRFPGLLEAVLAAHPIE